MYFPLIAEWKFVNDNFSCMRELKNQINENQCEWHSDIWPLVVDLVEIIHTFPLSIAQLVA